MGWSNLFLFAFNQINICFNLTLRSLLTGLLNYHALVCFNFFRYLGNIGLFLNTGRYAVSPINSRNSLFCQLVLKNNAILLQHLALMFSFHYSFWNTDYLWSSSAWSGGIGSRGRYVGFFLLLDFLFLIRFILIYGELLKTEMRKSFAIHFKTNSSPVDDLVTLRADRFRCEGLIYRGSIFKIHNLFVYSVLICWYEGPSIIFRFHCKFAALRRLLLIYHFVKFVLRYFEALYIYISKRFFLSLCRCLLNRDGFELSVWFSIEKEQSK